MRIRRARSPDLNAIADLWATCGLVPSPRGFRNEMQRKLFADPTLFLVADDGGDIVGAVMGGYDGRTAWVSRLAVRPTRRRSGVARQLVAALERHLDELGGTAHTLLVLDDSDDSRRFWTGLGYERSLEVPTYRRPRGGAAVTRPAGGA